MFHKILTANRERRPAAQRHRWMRVAHTGDFIVMEMQHV